MGIASLILGILSLLICWIPCVNYFAFIPAIIGVILGIVDIVKKNKSGDKKGLAIAGLVLSIIAVVVICIWTFVIGAAASSVDANSLENSAESLNSVNYYNY